MQWSRRSISWTSFSSPWVRARDSNRDVDLAVGRPIVPAHTRRGYRAESRTFDRRTLPLERASLRIERSSLRLVPSSLLIRAKDLLFSYLCRSSLYAGADIGQEEIPLRLTRRPDRGHRVAGRQRGPRGEAVLRSEGRARNRRWLRPQNRRLGGGGPLGRRDHLRRRARPGRQSPSAPPDGQTRGGRHALHRSAGG